ncbi:hypothetical protein [Sphingomonas bacterium]|uniref:hypothetical protein n=1 Tax=Sphingomonas bacterium TaxID=1895847 RepID=UPI001577695E|nr:hypothetical protein [Sphingomonas bacterium]
MRRWMVSGLTALTAATATPASADLVLNQVIVDLVPNKVPRMDIEAANTGKERIYVVVEPSEIVHPGQPDEARVARADPALLGLLVTPQKIILEPGERKLVRIASVGPRGPAERIYRVTIKPVIGDVSAANTALKVLVGYDVLVIVRPIVMTGAVTGVRTGSHLALTNNGTTNVEMFDGRQCDAAGAKCTSLPARRLYAGAGWEQTVDPVGPITYRIKTGDRIEQQRF